MNSTPIDVDYREDATVAGGLVDRLGGEWVVPRVNLKFGDLAWATDQCTYGVELKSVSDFFGSLWSREQGERLEWQLGGLRQMVDVPVLGIHGILWSLGGRYMLLDHGWYAVGKGYLYARAVKDTDMRVASVEGFLASVVIQGVTVIYRPSKEMLLDALAAYYTASGKDDHTTFNRVVHRGRFVSEDRVLSQYVGVLMAVDGLGERRARALLARFNTPAGVFTASDRELLTVDGVGKGVVKKIREAFGS